MQKPTLRKYLSSSTTLPTQHSVYTVRVDFENKPSDAERSAAERQRLYRLWIGYSFARFMRRMRDDHLARVAIADREFLQKIGVKWE
jgi:hypothetical protein